MNELEKQIGISYAIINKALQNYNIMTMPKYSFHLMESTDKEWVYLKAESREGKILFQRSRHIYTEYLKLELKLDLYQEFMYDLITAGFVEYEKLTLKNSDDETNRN